MILDGDDSPGFRITGPLSALAELDLECAEAAELHGFTGEYCALDFIEQGVDEAVDLFAVQRPTGVESFD